MNFELTEEQGIRVAKTLNDFNKISKTRSRTDEDVKEFSERLIFRQGTQNII